jgi:ABC-type branched-subunit amino acid transport system substrate-binding protein
MIFNHIADSIFSEGMRNFNLGITSAEFTPDTSSYIYFSRAYEKFESLIFMPFNHRTTASYIMLAKVACYLDRFDEASDILQDFLLKFPESIYVEDAHYTLGLVFMKLGRYKESAGEFIKAIEVAGIEGGWEKTMNMRKYKKILGTILDSLNVSELEEVYQMSGLLEIKFIVAVKSVEKFVNNDMLESAERFILDHLVEFVETEYYYRLEAKLTQLKRLMIRPEIKIGAFLPLDQRVGRSILRGIEIAVDEHNLNFSPKVGIEIQSYGDNSRDIDMKVIDLIKNPDIVAIIGPIYSDDVVLVSRFIEYAGIPTISPTATSDGLTRMSKYIFQANSDYSTRARAMAQYATLILELREFVILAPYDEEIKKFVDAFTYEVIENGGRIIWTEWYDPSETDLRYHFRNIQAEIESTSVDSIIGLYAPILSSDFIGIISSQIKYHDLDVYLLGNDMWNDFNELYLNRRYTDGVIFTMGNFIDLSNPSYLHFRDMFREKFDVYPDEYSLYGYDVTNMLLKLIQNGATSRGEIYKNLQSMEYSGIGKSIVFNSDRLNSSILILTFKDGEIRKLLAWDINR